MLESILLTLSQVWQPIVGVAAIATLFWYVNWSYNRPGMQEARDKAAWEEAHRHKPCPHKEN